MDEGGGKRRIVRGRTSVRVLWCIVCLLLIVVIVISCELYKVTNKYVRSLISDAGSTPYVRSLISDAGSTPKVKNILGLLKPKMPITNKRKVRIGRAGDGGYVMLDSFEEVQAVYGMGIGDDFSWEDDISRRVGGNVDVLMYDPTIDPPTVSNPQLKFYKLGICGSNTKAKDLLTFDEILKKDGNFDKENIVLKIDVEGAEWDAFKTVSREVLEKFCQIVVEFHDMCNLSDANYNSMMGALSNLSQTHEVIHVHANNFGDYQVIGGIPMPQTLEITYLRKEGWKFGKNTQIYPIKGLDGPNSGDGRGAEFILAFVENEFAE
jgi:hypothetical protein